MWAGATVATLAVWTAWRRRPLSAVHVVAVASVAAMVLTDVSYLATQGLRDLHLYLRAGEHFLDGAPVYLDRLFTQRPADLADYPFLYPPMTLPFFAALARLPAVAVDLGWLGASLAAAVATLRLFGLAWRWTLLFLVWPPFFQGLQVGNVAVPLGLLFALAPWFGAGLVIAGVFKVYSGIAALWLVRERRFAQIAFGGAIVVAAAVATLPLVGTHRWAEWWAGLGWFRDSQPLLADYLYGFGLPRYIPALVALGIAGVVTVAALRARGREGLARLGLATAVASPSLYAHGLIVALPAFLTLRTPFLWTVLAITSVAPGIAWWVAIAIGMAAWVVPRMRWAGPGADAAVTSLHPLSGGPGPWAPDTPTAGGY